MQTQCGIFLLKNKVNGKVFIEQSVNVDNFREQLSDRIKSYTGVPYKRLYAEIIKYGMDNFKIKLVEKTEQTELKEKEIYYKRKYNKGKEEGVNEYRETVRQCPTVIN